MVARKIKIRDEGDLLAFMEEELANYFLFTQNAATHDITPCNSTKRIVTYSGSISRWKFGTLRIQYTIGNYNRRRF
jgi:hypothetical protein